MKRDMNLIRELLLFYESDCTLPYPDARSDVIDQHIIWLIEANLIAGRLADSSPIGSPRRFFPVDGREFENNGHSCLYFPLTWNGCEFIAAARDNTRWRNALSVVGGFTFEIIKTYLQDLIVESVPGLHR
ncbi:DUF2513 domain-containing protein [Gimesia sp.]|uniref:DUF2513 domain-containing protein n=1 Tax=Gimesia sp. TaxID=2024833 RepID=UPI003A92BD76